jgi:hypothetical protein
VPEFSKAEFPGEEAYNSGIFTKFNY